MKSVKRMESMKSMESVKRRESVGTWGNGSRSDAFARMTFEVRITCLE
jgi:hypothetical protein